jgi:hypothetical protein
MPKLGTCRVVPDSSIFAARKPCKMTYSYEKLSVHWSLTWLDFSCSFSLPWVSELGLRTLRCRDRSRWAPHHKWELGAASWVWFRALVLTSLLRGIDCGGDDLGGVDLAAYFAFLVVVAPLLLLHSFPHPNIGLSMHISFNHRFCSLLGNWHDLPAYWVDGTFQTWSPTMTSMMMSMKTGAGSTLELLVEIESLRFYRSIA